MYHVYTTTFCGEKTLFWTTDYFKVMRAMDNFGVYFARTRVR